MRTLEPVHPEPSDTRNWSLAVLFAVALALRIWFFTAGSVVDPIHSDAREYFLYAGNLAYHGVMSMSDPTRGAVVPDSFRDPGYPFFLAVLLRIFGDGTEWYVAVLVLQSLLGALSCVLVTLLARRWLALKWAIGGGAMTAIWPHHVAIASFLLSETLFGFFIVLSLWLFARACERPRHFEWVAAGFAFGCCSLINSTMILFFPALALVLLVVRARPRQLVIAALVSSVVLPMCWQARNQIEDGGAGARGRGLMNLVQGSWPDFHSDYVASVYNDPSARSKMSTVDLEEELIRKDLTAGLRSIAGRMKMEPAHYLAWYLSKPWLLWSWSIRMGYGDIYPYLILHPIFLDNSGLRIVETLCFAVNPFLFILMTLVVATVLLRTGSPARQPALWATAMLLVYATALYTALHSEPRFSIPFRPLEMVAAASAFQAISEWRKKRTSRIKLAQVTAA